MGVLVMVTVGLCISMGPQWRRAIISALTPSMGLGKDIGAHGLAYSRDGLVRFN